MAMTQEERDLLLHLTKSVLSLRVAVLTTVHSLPEGAAKEKAVQAMTDGGEDINKFLDVMKEAWQ
jgi:hypothetical protein